VASSADLGCSKQPKHGRPGKHFMERFCQQYEILVDLQISFGPFIAHSVEPFFHKTRLKLDIVVHGFCKPSGHVRQVCPVFFRHLLISGFLGAATRRMTGKQHKHRVPLLCVRIRFLFCQGCVSETSADQSFLLKSLPATRTPPLFAGLRDLPCPRPPRRPQAPGF
jgi:hypothetical protein